MNLTLFILEKLIPIKLRKPTGITSFAQDRIDSSALSAFRCFIDDSILNHVVACTNAEATRRGDNEFRMTRDDLLAFIGVQLVHGLAMTPNVTMSEIFSKESSFCPPIIRRFLPSQRVLKIVDYLRFDDKSTRGERSADPFTMCRMIWEKFLENSR